MMDDVRFHSMVEWLRQHHNQENAEKMERYMQGLFSFIGLRSPERRNLTKNFIQLFHDMTMDECKPFILKLWELPEREFQNIALDILRKKQQQFDASHIDLIEYLIITKPWWDTVDTIASHLVGTLFLKHPELIESRGEKWLSSDHMWLQRTMILFQLKYKEKTDETLLFANIKRTVHMEQFFIQKAIGWSLREYSKSCPASVLHFIESQPLSNLAKREGLKYMQRKGRNMDG